LASGIVVRNFKLRVIHISGTEGGMEETDVGHIEGLIEHNKANPERKSVHINYHKMSTKRHVKRKVDPLSIKGPNLIAYDHKRKALRSFRMDRIKSMEKTAFWDGFMKRANAAAELAGLGLLAVPSIRSLQGKPVKEKTKDIMETAGLGILAAPYIHQLGKKLLTRGRAG
jgi:hypothetical protein